MTTIRNFSEANALLRDLYERYKSGVASDFYTLDCMRDLMTALGNPQEKLKILHVAGTSGKSSTSYYLAALLKASGCKVGHTVSPHVNEVNERIQLNLTPMPEAEFCKELGTFWSAVTATGLRPTYFEALTAFAFWEFARAGVDYAVIEVGLGGLLDATNVVANPDKVCVITDIGLDHMRILGNTIPEIAAQKAGIIQPHNEVFMYRQGKDVMDVLTAVCQRQHAELHSPAADDHLKDLPLPLFQQRNLGLAEQAVDFVLKRDGKASLNATAVQTAAEIVIPGRMETFRLSGKTLIVDGAHNEQKMTALIESVQAAYPNQPIAALVAVVQGQDERWQHALDILLRNLSSCIVTSFHQEHDDRIKSSMEAETVAGYISSRSDVPLQVEPNVDAAYELLLKSKEPVLLVTGSLYLLHDILRLTATHISKD